MLPIAKELCKSGSKNKEFLAAIKSADNNDKPGIFADDLTKTLFATVYYGWLIAKYGDDWELNL